MAAPQQPTMAPLQPQMGMQQPVMNPMQQPQMGMQQPVMNPMQQPQMGMQQPMMNPMQPQMGMQQPMMNPMQPQMGMQQPMMNPMQPQMGMPQMGMMPDPTMMAMPQMGYAMPQMQYGMPQFVGYDAMGNPLYVQQVPQIMGYDAYGNPMYTMVTVPVPMPQMGQIPMPAMPMMQPQMPVMEIAALPVQDTQELAAPPASQGEPSEPMPAVAVPEDAESEPIDYSGYDYGFDYRDYENDDDSSEEMPAGTSYFMTEDAVYDSDNYSEDGEVTIRDEEELLNRLFSDDPKTYSMSSNAKPGAMSFSIRLGTDEFTSVRDEEAPPPSTEELPKPRKKAAEPKEEKKSEPKAPASKKKPAAPKRTAKIVSPDEFFDDKPRQARGMIAVTELDKLSDDQLVDQLAAMQAQTSKKSRRTMKAASEDEVDSTNMIPDVMAQ